MLNLKGVCLSLQIFNNLEKRFSKVERFRQKKNTLQCTRKESRKSRKNERNVTNNPLQSMCSESVAIFCPTYKGFFFANRIIKHLCILDFEKFLFSKILILRLTQNGTSFVSFLYMEMHRGKKVNIVATRFYRIVKLRHKRALANSCFL